MKGVIIASISYHHVVQVLHDVEIVRSEETGSWLTQFHVREDPRGTFRPISPKGNPALRDDEVRLVRAYDTVAYNLKGVRAGDHLICLGELKRSARLGIRVLYLEDAGLAASKHPQHSEIDATHE